MCRPFVGLLGRAIVVLALVSTLMVALPAPNLAAAPPGDDEVVAFIVRGEGNGHGRGMSQWGAYGRALDGQTWTEILDAYYGGTVNGERLNARVRVRLTDYDGYATVGVISTSTRALWAGESYGALYAVETSANAFTIYGSPDSACPPSAPPDYPTVDLEQGATDSDAVRKLQTFLNYFGYDAGPVDGDFGPLTEIGLKGFEDDAGLAKDGLWRAADRAAAADLVEQSNQASFDELESGVAGPIVFETSVNESAAAAGSVLGVCRSNGAVQHYRGDIEVHHTSDGNRVVNDVDVENYLLSVVPKEVSPSWGAAGSTDSTGEPAGMHSLRAQAVAARSYGLQQNRYSYATTCDTTACQVYAGSAERTSASDSTPTSNESGNTTRAIEQTAGIVREWPDGSLVSTEFSASNGSRTAGGAFEAVDDPWDDIEQNPLHEWTRLIDADAVIERYGLGSASEVRTVADSTPYNDGVEYEGIWAQSVSLGNGESVTNWSFRGSFSLPSPGFVLIPVTRSVTTQRSLAFIGDSVGTGVAGSDTSQLAHLLDGTHETISYDARSSRRTAGGSDSGVDAAGRVPENTDLVVVELGYNDPPSTMGAAIDEVMEVLSERGVGLVAWVTVSERRASTNFAATNQAIRDAADRWPELIVVDWHSASDIGSADRWFSDDVHLTSTGNAEFSLFLRDAVVDIVADGYVPPRTVSPLGAEEVLRVGVLGQHGVPSVGVGAVALNVTAVNPVAAGHLAVWDCALDEPSTSAVNYREGEVIPNAAIVPLVPLDESGTGEVCISTFVDTDVVVDISGWFEDSVQVGLGRRFDSRVDGGERLGEWEVLELPMLGESGVPESGVAGVVLNVTATDTGAAGFFRVWDCSLEKPETSSVNYVAGDTSPNAVVVPFAADGAGEVCIETMAESHVVVDVTGWFDSAVAPVASRRFDSRVDGGERLGEWEVLELPMLGESGVPESGVAGVVLNVTATDTGAAGFFRVWDCSLEKPETSSVNYVAGDTSPNAVVVPFAADGAGEVCIETMAESHVVVDVAGWFDSAVRTATGRLADTRYDIVTTHVR